MLLDYFVMELFFGTLEAFATLIIGLMLFRFPIRDILLKLLGYSLTGSAFFLIIFNYLNVPFLVGEAFYIIVTVLFIKKILHALFWHSTLIVIIGYIAGSFIQAIIYLVLTKFNIIGVEMISNTPTGLIDLMTLQLIYFLVTLKTVIIFSYFKLGFLLVDKEIKHSKETRFTFSKIFFASFLTLIILLYFIHLIVYNASLYNGKKLAIVTFFFIVSFLIVYFTTKKSLNAEYEKIKQNVQL